jgi:hypothetical protein
MRFDLAQRRSSRRAIAISRGKGGAGADPADRQSAAAAGVLFMEPIVIRHIGNRGPGEINGDRLVS